MRATVGCQAASSSRMGFYTGFNVFQQGTRHPTRAMPITKVSPKLF